MLLTEQLKKFGENVLSKPGSAPDHAGCVMIDDHCHILVAFFIAGLINADIDQTVETGRADHLQLLIYTGTYAAHRMPFHPHELRHCTVGGVCAKPCRRILKAFGKATAMPRPGHRCGHYAVFPAAYARRFRLHVYFLCTHIQAAPAPPPASFVVPRCFPMADTAPALLLFRWPDGQIYFVHLGVGTAVLQDKSASSDDGLNKSLGSHLRSLFHDSLCDNKIIVVSSGLPRACSVFLTHSFYRRAIKQVGITVQELSHGQI